MEQRVCETNFPTVLFMKSKYSSITFNENLVSKLRYAAGVKYTVDLKELISSQEEEKNIINKSLLIRSPLIKYFREINFTCFFLLFYV